MLSFICFLRFLILTTSHYQQLQSINSPAEAISANSQSLWFRENFHFDWWYIIWMFEDSNLSSIKWSFGKKPVTCYFVEESLRPTRANSRRFAPDNIGFGVSEVCLVLDRGAERCRWQDHWSQLLCHTHTVHISVSIYLDTLTVITLCTKLVKLTAAILIHCDDHSLRCRDS